MTVSKFYLPDVGEGLTEAEIVSWKVKPGDSVAIKQDVAEGIGHNDFFYGER